MLKGTRNQKSKDARNFFFKRIFSFWVSWVLLMYTYLLGISESDCQSCGIPVGFTEQVSFALAPLNDIFPWNSSVE